MVNGQPVRIALSILICNSTRPLHIVRAVYISIKFACNCIVKCINSIKSFIE